MDSLSGEFDVHSLKSALSAGVGAPLFGLDDFFDGFDLFFLSSDTGL